MELSELVFPNFLWINYKFQNRFEYKTITLSFI